MRILTLLATSAGLAMAVGASASAQAIGDESVETVPAEDSAVNDVVVDDAVVDEGVVDEGVVDEGVVDGGIVIDDGSTIEEEAVVEDKVLNEEVAIGDSGDLDTVVSPADGSSTELDNQDVIFYTMSGGDAEDFGGGAADEAADLAVEQAADRALERIGIAAPAPVRTISTDKN